MITFAFRLVRDLVKVLPGREPEAWEAPALTLLSNERTAFQLAYFCRSGDFGAGDSHFTIRYDPRLTCRQVALVPCRYPCHDTWDDNYLTTAPGLLPDLLLPSDHRLKAIPGQWRSLWFTVEGGAFGPGQHTVTLEITPADGSAAVSFSLPVTVRPEPLPPQTLWHTEWFHADCLANYYHVPVFSDEHWAILDQFIGAAAQCGCNMLLTPVFTPPLDTAKGGERTTVQLVDISLVRGSYRFQFDKLRRWVELCRKHGITELEIAHLFTQWGAVAAPKILVREHGVVTPRFGWHTPAVGGAYTRFLHQFLPALKKELQALGMWEHTWFHLSDEPSLEQKDSYAAARSSIRELLRGCRVLDALSSYEFYEQGLVDTPVVAVDHLTPFLEGEVPDLWAYYCTAQAVDVPNRFIAMPSARNRILGVLLYVHRIRGFLHWGFNFYSTQYSLHPVDPFTVTDAGEAFPSGDPFLVYPGPKGNPWYSIRSEILREAMDDVRLLQLAESVLGRVRVLELVEQVCGYVPDFTHYPRENQFFTDLRGAIFAALDRKEEA